MIYVQFMTPSPWFPELSAYDAQEREDLLIEALFAAAKEAKPKAHCLCLIEILLGTVSQKEENWMKNLTAAQAQDKAYLLEAMVINKKSGHPTTYERVQELMQLHR